MPRLGFKKRVAFLALFLLALGICATPFVFHRGVDAAVTQSNVSFHDYTEYPTVLPTEYRNARLYWEENTTITVEYFKERANGSNSISMDDSPEPMRMNENNNAENPVKNPLSSAYYHMSSGWGNQFVALIENSSARDNNNVPVDVILRVRDIEDWGDDASTDRAYIYVDKYLCGTTASQPTGEQCKDRTNIKEVGPGDPIIFWLGSFRTRADISIEYIKKGSFSRNRLAGTSANVTNLALVSWDYDNCIHQTDKLFQGSEGFAVNSTWPGNTAFYYNTEAVGSTPTRYFLSQYQTNDGPTTIAGLFNGNIDDPYPYAYQYDGISYNNSFVSLISDIRGSYQFIFSADHAGSAFLIGGAAAYDIPNPTKSFGGNTVTDTLSGLRAGSEVNYYLTQEPIIENTENDALSFIALSHNGISDQQPTLDYYEIVDSFDKDLNIASVNDVDIKLIDIDTGQTTDASSYFTTTLSDIADGGKKLRVVANSAAISAIRGKRIQVHIVASIVNNPEKNIIPNTGKIIYHYNNRTCSESGGTIISDSSNCSKTTNTVNADLLEKIEVLHQYEENGEMKEFATVSDIICNNEVANSAEPRSNNATCVYNSSYQTNPISPDGYRLVSTSGDATGGTLDTSKTVIYYYVPIRTITVHHMIKTGGTWVEKTTVITDINCDGVVANASPRSNSASCDLGVDYTTASAHIPGYALASSSTIGDPSGTLDDDESVTYYYVPNITGFTLEKNVQGNAGETDRYFDVYVDITPAEGQDMPVELDYQVVGAATNETATVTNGTAVIPIRHGQVINVSLPADLTISIHEKDYSNEGYEVVYDLPDALFTNALAQNIGKVGIMNTREFSTPTGIGSYPSPALYIVSGMSASGILCYFVIKVCKSFAKK